jgi:hypothetical protein
MSDDEVAAPTGGMGEVDMDSNYPLDDLSNYDPQEVGSERDVSPDKDGGVTKKLLVRGEGFKMPEKGDEVTGAPRRGAARRRAFRKHFLDCCRRHARALTRPAARSALRRHAAGRHRV